MAGKMRDGLIKRGDKWSFVVRELDPVEGKTKPRWYSGYATRAEAKIARDEKRVKVDRRRGVGRRDVVLGEFLDSWLAVLDVKPKTAEGYRYNIERYILPRIGSRRLQDLNPSGLTEFYKDLMRNGGRNGQALGLPSIKSVHRTLSSALTSACRAEILTSNPAAHALLPRQPIVNPRAQRAEDDGRAMSPRELNSFLRAASEHRLDCLFHLAAYTGARRGELLHLRWSDIDLDGAEITVFGNRQTVAGIATEGTTKGGKVRRVSIDRDTVAALRAHSARQAQDRLRAGSLWDDRGDYVFLTERGIPIHTDTPSKLMHQLVQAAGLRPFRFHDLRHTHATLLLTSGVPAHEVADRLGHADSTITMRIYASVLKERRSGLGESFAEALRTATTDAG